MKSLNFWRALFVSALALTTFAACSDDDAEGGFKERPEISVNGKTSATVARDLEAGLTEAVEVVSAGPWSVEFDNAADAAWCTPMIDGKATLTSKGGGTSMLTFDLSGTDAARETSFTLIATGELMGYPLTAKATVTVKQNAGGSTAVDTNVAAVRALLVAMNPTQTKTEVTEEIAAMTLTGIVVSEAAGHNFGNDYNIAVQDAQNAPNSGLTLNANKFKDLALSAGKIVTISLAGAQVSTYGSVVQLAINNNVEIKTVDGDVTPEPVIVTPDQLLNYESQLVKIEGCYPADGVAGTAWNNATNKGNSNFMTSAGKAFIVRTGASASFKDELIPEKSGYIIGIGGQFNGDVQLSPRTAEDIVLDQEIPEAEYTKTTLDKLGAGNYEIENVTIVGVHQKGVMFAQQNEGAMNYVLAFNNDWTQTSMPYVNDVNKTATIKGASALRYGLYQFSNFTVTVGGASQLKLPEPENFDAAAIEAYTSAIAADESKAAYKYVKLAGKLGIVKNSSYNTYTITITGVDKNVTFAYGLDTYFADFVDGDMIDAKGFALGYDTKNNKLNILLTAISKNTDMPMVSFSSTPAQFAAENPSEQTIAYTKANITGSVEFSIEGTNADKFSVVSSTDAEVVVKAAGNNTSGSAYTAKLVAKYNGSTLAETDLKQAAKTTGGGEGGEADFSTLTANNSYVASVTTDAGWVGENVAVQSGGDKDSGPVFQSLLGSDSKVKGMVINGKTTAVGKITSPDLTGGCGTLSFDYGIAFAETKIDFKVEIKQGGEVVKSFDVKQESPEKFQKYSFSENVGVTGTFQIVITNNSPSASTGNKDRYTIFNIKWTGNDNGGDNPGTSGDTKGTYTSQDAFISNGASNGNPAGLGESKVNGSVISGFKIGTGSKVGTFTSAAVGVSGNKTLTFYAWAWKGKTAKLNITIEGGGTINGESSFALSANDGVTGNMPFNITNDDNENYYTVQIEGLTAASTITFSTESASAGRAVVCGIQLF